MADRKETALRIAREQHKSLEKIKSTVTGVFDGPAGLQRLERWKKRTIRLLAEYVSVNKARSLEDVQIQEYTTPFWTYTNGYSTYQGHMVALVEALAEHPDEILERPDAVQPLEVAVPVEDLPAAQSVFIVHGRDEVNLTKAGKTHTDSLEA